MGCRLAVVTASVGGNLRVSVHGPFQPGHPLPEQTIEVQPERHAASESSGAYLLDSLSTFRWVSSGTVAAKAPVQDHPRRWSMEASTATGPPPPGTIRGVT